MSKDEVALVHDWLTGMRGGEKVLESLCEIFPDAPVYTLLHVPGSVSPIIEQHDIRKSLLQKMPFAYKHYRNYLPFFPLFAETHKAPKSQLVFSTSHAVAKNMVRKSKKQVHVSYIHSPMRYVWDRFDDYFGANKVGRIPSFLLFRPLARVLQIYDRWTSRRVDHFIANSSFVRDRIKKFYGRDAEVLPPPVDLDFFNPAERKPEDWYLVLTALVPYKNTEHAIEASKKLGFKLKIVGKGPEESKLKKLAQKLGANVEFIGFVSDSEIRKFYWTAKALLFPGVEDFGIVPVEAAGCGCPVVCLKQGGILDSMTPETAVFYDSPGAESLSNAILEFEKKQKSFIPEKMHQSMLRFSKKAFQDNLLEILKKFKSGDEC